MKKLVMLSIIGLVFANIGCYNKNTTGSCFDKVMEGASKDLQDNALAQVIVIDVCKKSNNDPKLTLEKLNANH